MNRAYKYRLYPNKEQQIMFAKTFGCARFIYNAMLHDRLEFYKTTGKKLNNRPAQYKNQYPWLKEVDCLALCNAQLNLNKAYNNFFRNPKQFGRPKYKSKKSGHLSYQTNNQIDKNNHHSIRIEGNKIRLPKVGLVKIRLHRPLMPHSIIKTVTISKTPSGKYYISILVEYENQILPIIPKKYLGLDFTMHGLYSASDEEDANYPNYYHQILKRLAKAQRKLAKKKLGSHKRNKLKKYIAKLYEKASNQRLDFLHKKAFYLANKYDAIGIEDISVKNMAKRKKGKKYSFGKSVLDNGWCMFTNILKYKLEWQGKQLIKVDKWYASSQLCHVCGYKNTDTKDLSIRKWTCPQCGTKHDRDKNAALNIREEAKRIS